MSLSRCFVQLQVKLNNVKQQKCIHSLFMCIDSKLALSLCSASAEIFSCSFSLFFLYFCLSNSIVIDTTKIKVKRFQCSIMIITAQKNVSFPFSPFTKKKQQQKKKNYNNGIILILLAEDETDHNDIFIKWIEFSFVIVHSLSSLSNRTTNIFLWHDTIFNHTTHFINQRIKKKNKLSVHNQNISSMYDLIFRL